MHLKNETIRNADLLNALYQDGYFPNFLVDKIRDIIWRMCERIERDEPSDLEALYVITHNATDEINELQEEFFNHNSEIETVARDKIGEAFAFVAYVYGFKNADVEELIATRDW